MVSVLLSDSLRVRISCTVRLGFQGGGHLLDSGVNT